MLKIGARVRILKMDDEEPIYVGSTGTLVDINPIADDGDAFGVHLDGSKEGSTIYFWAKELEVISAMKRTSDDLDKLIESFGYGYAPVDETSKSGKVRYLAFAHRLKDDGKMEDEVTAFFGYEDELLKMDEVALELLIGSETSRASREYDESE